MKWHMNQYFKGCMRVQQVDTSKKRTVRIIRRGNNIKQQGNYIMYNFSD